MRKAGIRSHRGSGAPNSGLTTKEKLTQELEIPQAALRGVSHMELSGNREAIVEGCKGVVEYDEGIIRLNLGKKYRAVYRHWAEHPHFNAGAGDYHRQYPLH